MSDEAEARLGTRLGNYALKEIIGLGGMGVVYRAAHIYLRKPAAVKVLYRRFFEQPGAKARFLNEARNASLVDHPNIVGVTDFGEAPDGTIYIVMAEARGVGLDTVLGEEGLLPLFRALGIMSQVVHALAAVHAQGVVHRDIKPENILLERRSGKREILHQVREVDGCTNLVEPEGTFDFVTLLDFGAARVLQPESPTQGEQGRLFGTPAYLAPETAQTGHADARSDVYSVAVVFYEMLTGHVPIEGASTAETLQKHICQLPEPPRKRNPHVEITPEAERVILRGLEKDPGRRQASMGELWQELQRCYGAMRWRRPSEPLESGLPFETLRAPPPQASVERVSILREPVRPENTPTPPHGVGYAPEPAKHKPQAPLPEEIPTPPPAGIENRPRPLLLTKRKSAPRPAVVNPDEEITPPLVRQR